MHGIALTRRLRLARAFPIPATLRAPADNDDLSISDIRAWPLREPVSGRRYTVVRLRAKSGLSGFGECEGLEPDDLRYAAQVLTGKAATAVEALGALLRGRRALNAAVNIAALDLAARFAKTPLYQYLGGPTRFKVRAMTRLDGVSDAELTESLLRARAAGFRAFVVPLPARGVRQRLDTLRAAAGSNTDFVIDAAEAGLSAREAGSLCRELESFHPFWVDEPCPASNLQTACRLAREYVAPLGFGRDIVEAGRFEDLLREEAIDVLRPSIARNGISSIRKLAAMAETRYAAVAPYHAGGPIGTAAALHLAASLPNFFIQQIPFSTAPPDRAMRAALGGAALESPAEGFLALPQGNGLGIDPDPRTFERYLEVTR